jgi:hypothetical protein
MRISGKAALLFALGALFTGLAFAAFAGEARAQPYGSDENGNLFTFDVTTGATTPVGAPGTLDSGVGAGCCTEIEYDNTTRRAWAQERNGGFVITGFDINTGLLIGAPVPDGQPSTDLSTSVRCCTGYPRPGRALLPRRCQHSTRPPVP